MPAYIDNRESLRPSIIVPDVHGRVRFVEEVFKTYSPESYDIVFTGDIFHRERFEKEWIAAEDAFIDKDWPLFEQLMDEELTASFDSLDKIEEQREKYPKNVFLLRGNHDDMACNLVGDYGKYCRRRLESKLFREASYMFCKKSYEWYIKYEKTIPYLYIGHNFIASHTVPITSMRLKDVKLGKDEVHFDFCWTDNVYSKSYERHFESNFYRLAGERHVDYWFIGHRPVKDPDLVRIQQNGRLIQNNHPGKWVVIECPSEGPYVALQIN